MFPQFVWTPKRERFRKELLSGAGSWAGGVGKGRLRSLTSQRGGWRMQKHSCSAIVQSVVEGRLKENLGMESSRHCRLPTSKNAWEPLGDLLGCFGGLLGCLRPPWGRSGSDCGSSRKRFRTRYMWALSAPPESHQTRDGGNGACASRYSLLSIQFGLTKFKRGLVGWAQRFACLLQSRLQHKASDPILLRTLQRVIRVWQLKATGIAARH